MQVRAAQHEVGAGIPGPARPGDQVLHRGSRSQSRSALACQQADHGHRAADRHDGLDRRALFGDHQGRADRRHRLLQLRRLLRRGNEVRRLGHGDLRGQVAQAGLSLRSRTTRPSCAMPRTCGARRCGRPKRSSRRRHQDPQMRVCSIGRAGRERRALRLHRERSAPRRRPLRRGHGDGLEEPEGGGHSRHQGRGRASRTPRRS